MEVDLPTMVLRKKMLNKPFHVENIDAVRDPLSCSEYAQDIITYLQVTHICLGLGSTEKYAIICFKE